MDNYEVIKNHTIKKIEIVSEYALIDTTSTVVNKSIAKLSTKTENKFLTELSTKVVDGNLAAKLTGFAINVGKSFDTYLSSDMDEAEFMYKVCEDAVDTAAEFAIAEVSGDALMCIVGFIAGPELVGVALLAKVVGEIFGCVVGEELCNKFHAWIDEPTYADIYLNAQRELAASIDEHTRELAYTLSQMHAKHEENIMNAFKEMLFAMTIRDYDFLRL